MLARGEIEIRFHEGFKDAEVARLVCALVAKPGLAVLWEWDATYQGRRLSRA
jgi:hypothetical protein